MRGCAHIALLAPSTDTLPHIDAELVDIASHSATKLATMTDREFEEIAFAPADEEDTVEAAQRSIVTKRRNAVAKDTLSRFFSIFCFVFRLKTQSQNKTM